ncbi:MAG: aldehyde dehydrogenase family protein [Candidatus Micrarchaeota archaeon]|nr:aldehyde dehydrogenase family protein [Candidatus Micrarchaeota archaeon]
MKRRFENEYTYKRFVESGREDEFDGLFDAAVRQAEALFGKQHPIYINGKEIYATELLVERSPINSSVTIGSFQKGTKDHARQAVAAAKAAFASWGETDYRERAKILRKAAEIISGEKFLLSAILSYENGKSRYESVGEVDEAIDFMHYYCDEMESNKGFSRKTSQESSTAKVSAGFQGAPSGSERVSIRMRPFGVFGVIAPFNFPVSISTGMSAAALVTGNTVVFKPSSTDNMSMMTGLKLYEALKRAGIPDGVFNYVTGPGSEVGAELAINQDVSGIAFTGSGSTGMSMAAKSYANGQRKTFVVEMGGKNPAIVSKYADLDDAVSGCASAAFGFAGQKCSALSRVYVHSSVKEQFVSKLIDRARNFRVGNPLDKEVYIGPLISESAYKRYVQSVEHVRRTGRLLYGGDAVQTGLKGHYVQPVIAEVAHTNEIVKTELFLPFVTVEEYEKFDAALSMANDVEYGLTAALYSRNKREIKEFSERIEAGVVYINRPISATTGAIVGLHTFVGWKGSALTGKGTGSKFYLPQFMREQSLSITK